MSHGTCPLFSELPQIPTSEGQRKGHNEVKTEVPQRNEGKPNPMLQVSKGLNMLGNMLPVGQ